MHAIQLSPPIRGDSRTENLLSVILAYAEEERRKEQEEKRKARDAEEQVRIEKIRQFYFGPEPSNDDGLDLAA